MQTELKLPLQDDTGNLYCGPKKGERVRVITVCRGVQFDVALPWFSFNTPLESEGRLLKQVTPVCPPSHLHFFHLSSLLHRVFILLLLLPPPTSLDLEQKPPPPPPPPLLVSCFSILLVTAAVKQTRGVREMMCQWKVL